MSNDVEYDFYPINKGIGDIISQSWRLYRVNFTKIVIYAIIPTIIYAMFQAFTQIIPVFMAKLLNSFPATILLIFVGVISFLIALLTALISNFAMANATHNIIMGKGTNLNQVIGFLQDNFISIARLIGIIFAEIIAFAIIDFIVMMVLMTFFSFNITLLSSFLHSIETISIIVFISMLIFISVFSGIFIGLQVLFIILQIVIFSSGYKTILDALEISKNVIITERNKNYLFVFLLFSLWYILTFYFNLPVSFLSYLPIIQGNSKYLESLPFIIVVVTFWSNIAGMLLWPLVVCSITMYYYQWQIKHRGLDLCLKLQLEKSLLPDNSSC